MECGIFGGKEIRRSVALEKLYEQNISCFLGIPNIGLTAINRILGELFNTGKMPRLNMALLKINYIFEALPLKRNNRGKITNEYSVRFFGRLYALRHSRIPVKILVNVHLNVKKLSFFWGKNFREEPKKFELGDLVYCADLTEKRFKAATGMAVKKTSKQGVFRIGGNLVNLSYHHGYEFLLVFFDKGNLFIFDFNGQKIMPISIHKASHKCKAARLRK